MTYLHNPSKFQNLIYFINKENQTFWDMLVRTDTPNSSLIKEEMTKQGFDQNVADEIVKLKEFKCVTILDIHDIESYQKIEFSPGHPIPGLLYRRHPLKKKINIYIDYKSYYSLLLEERQAELTKILFCLGAKEICIIDTTSDELQKQLEVKANFNHTVKAQGSLHKSINGKLEASLGLDLAFQRIVKNQGALSKVNYYKCVGKPWSKYINIQKNEYEWLKYSPDWDTIIEGRIHNQLQSAFINLTTNNYSGVSDNLSLKFQKSIEAEASKLGSVGATINGQGSILSNNETSNQILRIIKVRFPEDFTEDNDKNDRLLQHLQNK